MNRLRLRQRIPLLGRPFYERDRAIEERNDALQRAHQVEMERDEARATLQEMRETLEQVRNAKDQLSTEIQQRRWRLDYDLTIPDEFVTFPVTVEPGVEFRLIVEADNRSSYDQYFFETRGCHELAYLCKGILQGDGTLIDLGANIGTVCLPVAATGSRVIAVEMGPRNVLKLALAALVNRFDYFRIIQAAVTDKEGLVGFVDNSAWGHVSAAENAAQATGLKLTSILGLVELDSPSLIRAPIVMKIDIEGHELAALHGAEGFLRKHRPIMIFESIQSALDSSGNAQEVKRFVSELGYSLHMIRGSILSPHLPDDQQIGLVSDILAVPNEKSALVTEKLSQYQWRPLSPSEQIAWLREIAPHGDPHRRHVIAVIPWVKKRAPELEADLDELMLSLTEEAHS